MDTIFAWSTWHAFAKARMHTDSSHKVLGGATALLGQQLRSFSKNVCPNFCTKELPSETAARVRRLIRTVKVTAAPSNGGIFKSIKSFNLSTYKNHALGDYVFCIPKFGTTDSYSTQIVSPFTSYIAVTDGAFRVNRNITVSSFSMPGQINEGMSSR